MLMLTTPPHQVLVIIFCPACHRHPPHRAEDSECNIISTKTTARTGLLYCRFALLQLPSPPIELWCLCYLILGIHLATAVDTSEHDNTRGAGLHHHRLITYKNYGGNTIQQLLVRNGDHKRTINEINDILVNHRQSNNIRIASLQSHIKQFSKIRTTEGGYKLADQRLIRDIGEVEAQTVTESGIVTTESWIPPETITTTDEPTPPSHMSPVHPTAMDSMGSNVVVFVLVLALVLATLGVLTCILSTYRYRTGGGGGGGMGGRARSELPSDTPGLLGSNANLPMLALPGGMCEEREVAALRDRHVRLKSVRTDMVLDLPPNIRLPDGEELPYGCATRLHIRDPEQESEIYQKCVRPPPNRTVFDGESPPPYRSSSAGLLSHATPGSIDWAQDTPPEKVIRCHSMSSGSSRSVSAPSTAPAVVVPTRSRRLSAFSDTGATGGALSQLTMVPCHRGAEPPV